ncbi:unnamed protein product [Urochloa humidicola]
MCRSKSIAYFAHDPAHRLLPSTATVDDDEFTCGGCLVAGAGPRYRCVSPGCGFTIHEACALRFPRSLKSALHPQHRLRRRRETAGGGCDVCGEDVKGGCYDCAACGVAVHPLCARMPSVVRGGGGGGADAHPADHEAWLGRAASLAAAAGCASCGRPVRGAWLYRCAACGAELHPRCLVPAAEQCRGGGSDCEDSVAGGCCCGLLHYVTYCLVISSYGYYYRS